MKPLEEMLMYQKALRQRRTPSVMNQAPAPAWQPEYEKEPPLEAVSPEDFIPSPKTIAALAAKGAGAAGGLVGAIRNQKYLHDMFSPESWAKKEIQRYEHPERLFQGMDVKDTEFAGAPVGDMVRYETKRPLFDKGVAHYDAAGGQQAMQISGMSHIGPDGEELSPATQAKRIRDSQLRIGNIKNIPEESAIFTPYDRWAGGGPGSRPTLAPGQHEFYINQYEGYPEIVPPGPANLKVRDILNDPDLRYAYNLSLAAPTDSPMHMMARILRDPEIAKPPRTPMLYKQGQMVMADLGNGPQKVFIRQKPSGGLYAIETENGGNLKIPASSVSSIYDASPEELARYR